jgi:diguanylate cyclase (GGDEF)-like protein
LRDEPPEGDIRRVPKLLLTNGLEKRLVPLGDQPLTVGRDPDNSLAIEGADVSRHHCRIERDGPGAWRVIDLGSKNGTYLNGRPVTAPTRISLRDTITVGEATLVLSRDDEGRSDEGTTEDEQRAPRASIPPAPKPFLEPAAILDKPKSGFWSHESDADLFAFTEDDDPSSSEKPLPPGLDRRQTRSFLKDQLLHLNFLSQAIASELDLDRLLDQILDAVLDFTRFERGLLLLLTETGELRPVRARNLDRDSLPEGERAFSSKVIDTALKRRDATLVRETAQDELARSGFDPKASWASLGLKSALCLPLLTPVRSTRRLSASDERRVRSAPTRVLGAIYLDSRRDVRSFDAKDRRLLRAVGHQAAMALQNAKLHHQATTDPLTQLANRGFFEQLFVEELKRAAEENTPLAFLMLDLDRFKLVNDRYGHQVGDQVLREVARRVKESIRRDDLAGRYGGEELCVLLPGADGEAAKTVAYKIRQALRASPLSEAKLGITVSIGISVFPDHGRDTTSLVKRADQALYQAKQTGRDRAELWRGSLDRSGHRMDALAGIVSGDIARDQRNLMAILEAVELSRAPMDPTEYLSLVLDKVLDVSRGERTLLFLGDSADHLELVATRGRGGSSLRTEEIQFSGSTVRNAVLEKRALCVLDAAEGSWIKNGPSSSIESLKLKTVMCVPLVARRFRMSSIAPPPDQFVGALYVDDKAAHREFTQGDLVALEALAHELAATLAYNPRFARPRSPLEPTGHFPPEPETELEILRAEVLKLREENKALRETTVSKRPPLDETASSPSV